MATLQKKKYYLIEKYYIKQLREQFFIDPYYTIHI
jgi:hypothetical protein